MKAKFLIIESKVPAWVQEARAEYTAKIRPFFPGFEIQTLKSPGIERAESDVKRRREGELVLKAVDLKDMLILFDESGVLARHSEDFAAKQLSRVVESGKARAVFCIGGAYGFDSAVRGRADGAWSLSPLTMNHWIAQLAALEQLYRGFTILNRIPYHNR